MKAKMECSVCGKIHLIDLRVIDTMFTCDACGHRGGSLEEKEIDVCEKQIRMSERLGFLAIAFVLFSLISFWLWLKVYDRDPSPTGFHEIAVWVFGGSSFLALTFGLFHSISNRKVYF